MPRDDIWHRCDLHFYKIPRSVLLGGARGVFLEEEKSKTDVSKKVDMFQIDTRVGFRVSVAEITTSENG